MARRKGSWTGNQNPRWNGGNSEYPNHGLLKTQRIEALKRSQGKCEVCKNPAFVVHHIDGLKSNHALENLIVLCTSCHFAAHRGEIFEYQKTSKFVRRYGMTLRQMSEQTGIDIGIIYKYLMKKIKHPDSILMDKIQKLLGEEKEKT